jgi:very-short-patch-repair endonuclease
VLDFFCPAARLCIELDGAGHFSEGGYEHDTARTEYLKALDIIVVRFENRDVFEHAEGVLEEIRKRLDQANHPLPSGYPSLTKEGS